MRLLILGICNQTSLAQWRAAAPQARIVHCEGVATPAGIRAATAAEAGELGSISGAHRIGGERITEIWCSVEQGAS